MAYQARCASTSCTWTGQVFEDDDSHSRARKEANDHMQWSKKIDEGGGISWHNVWVDFVGEKVEQEARGPSPERE